MLEKPVRIAARCLSVIEAAAAAAPPEAAGFTAGTRVCGECWVIPVGLEAADRVVPVGLVGMVTVRLPVGAVGTSAVTATAAVAALTLAETSWSTVLAPGQQIRGGIERTLPGLEIVAEIGVRQSPVEAVQKTNGYLGVSDLIAVHGVLPPQVIQGVHVEGDGAVHPAGQQVSHSHHLDLFSLQMIANPLVQRGQILHDFCTSIHRGRIRTPDIGAVLQVHAA